MSHSLTKIWIHLIFSTKGRLPLIQESYASKLYAHIQNKMNSEFNCLTKCINGTEDHIHILFLLDPNYSLSNIVKNIKGESSYWINSNNLINDKFLWQTGYAAFSVSESIISEVYNYILNQKEHHKKMTFREEYDLFMKKFG